MGAGVALYANAALQAAIKGAQEVLGALKRDGSLAMSQTVSRASRSASACCARVVSTPPRLDTAPSPETRDAAGRNVLCCGALPNGTSRPVLMSTTPDGPAEARASDVPKIPPGTVARAYFRIARGFWSGPTRRQRLVPDHRACSPSRSRTLPRRSGSTAGTASSSTRIEHKQVGSVYHRRRDRRRARAWPRPRLPSASSICACACAALAAMAHGPSHRALARASGASTSSTSSAATPRTPNTASPTTCASRPSRSSISSSA